MNKVAVEIMGRAYTLTSEESIETTKKIAGYVDEKIKGLSKNFPSLSLDKLAILTCLEIADELFKTKSELGKRAERLVSMIDNI